jgi:hypothetical protein
MRAFFRRRGYKLTRHRYRPEMRLNARKLYLMYGMSALDPKAGHMAVYRGHSLYYDGAGRRRRAFKGRPLWVYVPEKVEP